MQTKIEVEKTYWVGMTVSQCDALIYLLKYELAVTNAHEISVSESDVREGLAALNDMRRALLNG